MGMKKPLRFWIAVGIWLSIFTLSDGFSATEIIHAVALGQNGLVRVKVHRLTVDPTSENPVVVLVDSTEERALLIWIDFFEARAISMEMQGIKSPRPLTHDLLENVIRKAQNTVHRIVITHIRENTYYAKIVMELDNAITEIDARPSDSIVMALKFDVPIFVSETLFTEKAVSLGVQNDIEKKYGLTLQELSPALAEYFSFGTTNGVFVSQVRKGSHAQRDRVPAL